MSLDLDCPPYLRHFSEGIRNLIITEVRRKTVYERRDVALCALRRKGQRHDIVV